MLALVRKIIFGHHCLIYTLLITEIKKRIIIFADTIGFYIFLSLITILK